MGFFGGDNDREPSEAETLAQEQLETNKAELEAKKQSLYQSRLDIIKGQGKEQWTPDMNKRAPVKTSNMGGMKEQMSKLPSPWNKKFKGFDNL
jgi:hypothetical protein